MEGISLHTPADKRVKDDLGYQYDSTAAAAGSHTLNEPLIDKHGNLGKKTMNFLDSLLLTINSVTGPGVVALPLLYHEAGWFIPTFFMIVIGAISALASVALCEAIRLLPGNRYYEKRIEFCNCVREYFGYRWYILSQIFYNMTLQTHNISAIVVSARVLDELFAFIIGKSYALQMFPFELVSSVSIDGEQMFHEHGLVLTLGYMAVLTICMPMGFLNLDENIYFQWVSFIILAFVACLFGYNFFTQGLDGSGCPAFGHDFSTAGGICLFSFTYVVTIPSWVNEKKPEVSVNKTIWWSNIISIALFVFLGLFGALAYPHINTSSVLDLMAQQANIYKISTYIFAIGVIGLGIPHFAVMVRYNLFVGGLCGAGWSSFWGVVSPWLIGFCLYQGSGFLQFVNWTTILFSGFINFVAPVLLYWKGRRLYGAESDRLDAIEARSLVGRVAPDAAAEFDSETWTGSGSGSSLLAGKQADYSSLSPSEAQSSEAKRTLSSIEAGSPAPVLGAAVNQAGRSLSAPVASEEPEVPPNDDDPIEIQQQTKLRWSERESLWSTFPRFMTAVHIKWTLIALAVFVEGLSLVTIILTLTGHEAEYH